jgi:geranylgeranyl pyrophosphate synthase
MKEHTIDSIKYLKKIFEERGRESYEVAREVVLKEELSYKPLREALKYFMENVWYDFEHPALLSLACESVGGRPESTTLLGACLVLLAGAMDIHDDIIDQSRTKNSKLTVFGKFGKDLALLVGDALLVKGYTLLNEACEKLPRKKAKSIPKAMKKALFEVGNAEAEETSLKGNWNVDPEVYFDIIKRKSALAEVAVRIGAMIGNGNSKEITALSRYGRILGILANLRNEFVDIYEVRELKNRIKNECLPIPILYAFRNPEIKNKVTFLFKERLKSEETMEIVHIVMSAKEVLKLKHKMKSLAEVGVNSLAVIENQNIKELLKLLLIANLEGL